MIADLEYLNSDRIETAEVQIGERSDGTPVVVKVRGMTRQEMLDVPASEGPKVSERWSLARCMIAPEMTEDQVAAWQKVAPAAEVESVARAVNRLSGIENGQLKERYKSLGS